MNIFSFLDQLGTSALPSGPAPRRQLLRQLGQAGARAAVAALPLAALVPAAQAAPTGTSFDAVTLLLSFEELMSAFYTQALASPVLTAAAQATVRPDFELLLREQQDHVQFLRSVLSTAGVTPAPAAAYDFSGRRNNASNPVLFPDVFTDLTAFLQLAQQLEDASVGVYLGQLSFFTNDKLLFDAMFRMQLVESRHASHLRTLRRTLTGAVVKNWPSTGDAALTSPILLPTPAGSSTATASIYTFEANETQLDASNNPLPFPTILTATTAVQARALAEAFDEPLSDAQTNALLKLFS
jgi:hypothetical protein